MPKDFETLPSDRSTTAGSAPAVGPTPTMKQAPRPETPVADPAAEMPREAAGPPTAGAASSEAAHAAATDNPGNKPKGGARKKLVLGLVAAAALIGGGW